MWKLVWADEFDRDGRPDPRNWTFETGFVRNNELQWYQSNNARCENGLLIIEGHRERVRNPGFAPGHPDWRKSRQWAEYTSASMTTRGIHSWLYGRFELRARIDTRSGMWPAFWTLGVHGEWPSGGEIDILEYYRGMLLFNAAWATDKRFTPNWSTVRKQVSALGDPSWAEQFHIWRMDWDKDEIKLYVDDELCNTVDLRQTYNEDQEGKNPFHQPHYIIINLAIGGTNGGDPTKTEFPARFEVDYVRVYQR